MNEHERVICGRFRDFRVAMKWSQAEFANHLNITRNQMAGIEYARNPLQYEIAWNARAVFGISLSWLATNIGSPDDEDLDAWPPPETLGKALVLLSQVEASLWSDLPRKPHARALHKKKTFRSPQRSTLLSILKDELLNWMAHLPDEKVQEFAAMLVTVSEDYLDKLTKDSAAMINKRRGDLVFDSMRLEVAKRLLGKTAGDSLLTYKATTSNLADEKGEWLKLKKRIQQATSDSGSKSKLAKFLGVDLTQLSKWLTDSDSAREPGAEYTLQMQAWVADPKRQK